MWTISQVQQHPNCMIVCDDDATLELRVKTVRYFKGLMKVHTEMLAGSGGVHETSGGRSKRPRIEDS